ncbi:MAG: hypothetical protein JWL77_2673 [Chthonomonadaceae bacterium]|nr:hypothetical protein [Chthonomonadaceae bacterium]
MLTGEHLGEMGGAVVVVDAVGSGEFLQFYQDVLGRSGLRTPQLLRTPQFCVRRMQEESRLLALRTAL